MYKNDEEYCNNFITEITNTTTPESTSLSTIETKSTETIETITTTETSSVIYENINMYIIIYSDNVYIIVMMILT